MYVSIQGFEPFVQIIFIQFNFSLHAFNPKMRNKSQQIIRQLASCNLPQLIPLRINYLELTWIN